jgi:hypothetical protein
MPQERQGGKAHTPLSVEQELEPIGSQGPNSKPGSRSIHHRTTRSGVQGYYSIVQRRRCRRPQPHSLDRHGDSDITLLCSSGSTHTNGCIGAGIKQLNACHSSTPRNYQCDGDLKRVPVRSDGDGWMGDMRWNGVTDSAINVPRCVVTSWKGGRGDAASI